MSAFFCVVLSCVGRELRRADPPYKVLPNVQNRFVSFRS
jgi:hypothetical protein